MSERPVLRSRDVTVAIEPRAVTVEVAATIYGLSESQLRRLIADGVFPARRSRGRVVVIVAEADAWVADLPKAAAA